MPIRLKEEKELEKAYKETKKERMKKDLMKTYSEDETDVLPEIPAEKRLKPKKAAKKAKKVVKGCKKRDFIALSDFSGKELLDMIDLGIDLKKSPQKYSDMMAGKTMLMLFTKPSLRTHLSFDVAMSQMGGHAIYYNTGTGPFGKKETIHDTAKCVSRYMDVVMARLHEHRDMEELAEHCSVPVINGLTDFNHPCQVLGDMMAIKEHKRKLKGLTLAYMGDSNNNMTHSLMYGCAKLGVDMVVGCPKKKCYMPLPKVVKDFKEIAKTTGAKLKIEHDPKKAVKGADVVYTDSWMSYHIPEKEKARRIRDLKKYRVTVPLMKLTKRAIFMHCLPAQRGIEMTAEVIDGKQSIVFDEAENRLHIQKAIILRMMGLA